MGHGNFRYAGHTEPPAVTVAPSFLPTSLLPPLQLSCAPGAAPDTSASKPQAGILSHPPAPATRSSQTEGFFGGEEGVALALWQGSGADGFTSLSVTEGVASDLAQAARKKAPGEGGDRAGTPLPPAVRSLCLGFLFPCFVPTAGIVFSRISSSLPSRSCLLRELGQARPGQRHRPFCWQQKLRPVESDPKSAHPTPPCPHASPRGMLHASTSRWPHECAGGGCCHTIS